MPSAPGVRRVFVSCLTVVLLAGVLALLRSAQNQDTSSAKELIPTKGTVLTPGTPDTITPKVKDAPRATAAGGECQKLYAELRQFMDSMPTQLRSIKGDAAKQLAANVTRHEGLCRDYIEKCASQPSGQVGEVEFIYAKHMQALKLRRQGDFLAGARTKAADALRGWLDTYMGEVERLANSAFEKLPEDHPERPQALQLAGQAASAAFHHENAQRHFAKFLRLYPDHAEGHAIQLALARALFDVGAYEKAVRVTLEGIEKYDSSVLLPTYGELLWKIYHAMGDFDGMEECVQRVEELYPVRLAKPGLAEEARPGYERFLDFNGFRRGYLHFARGDFAAARAAFQEHIDRLDGKEKAFGSLKPESNVYRMRSADCLSVVEELAGLPAPAEFNLGEGWITRKHVRVAESTGKAVAVVFRGVDNARSAVFLGPLSRFCASRPDIEMVTISYLQGPESMRKLRDRLNAELGTLDFEGAAGFDPDFEAKQIFRKYHANVGSATFVILNRRGELVWFMQDPRGVDVKFAEKLLTRVAQG